MCLNETNTIKNESEWMYEDINNNNNNDYEYERWKNKEKKNWITFDVLGLYI